MAIGIVKKYGLANGHRHCKKYGLANGHRHCKTYVFLSRNTSIPP
jgi:hypothetical protein